MDGGEIVPMLVLVAVSILASIQAPTTTQTATSTSRAMRHVQTIILKHHVHIPKGAGKRDSKPNPSQNQKTLPNAIANTRNKRAISIPSS
jgi:hypothetical protein